MLIALIYNLDLCKKNFPLFSSYLSEPEGNPCSLTDSTAEEHVLAMVEHAADEARDRINRYMPNSKVLHSGGFRPHVETWLLLLP